MAHAGAWKGRFDMRMAHAVFAADAHSALRRLRFCRGVRFGVLGIAACLTLVLASLGLPGRVSAAGSPSTVAVGSTPVHVTINPNTSHAFVADYDYLSPGVSTFYDAATPPSTSSKISGSGSDQYSSQGNVPWDITVDTATNHVFVSNVGNHYYNNQAGEYLPAQGYSVTVIQDGSTLPSQQAGVIFGFSSPLGIAANPTTEHVFVFSHDNSKQGAPVIVMIQDGSAVPTSTAGQIALPFAYDSSTQNVTTDTTVPSIAVDPANNMVYLADSDQYGCGCVYAFQDSTSLTAVNGVISVALTKIPVGQAYDPTAENQADQLTSLAVNPTTKHLVVCDYTAGTVAVVDIDPSSASYQKVIATIPLGSQSSPDGITVNPLSNHVFVVDSQQNQVDVIQDSTTLPILPVFARISTGQEPEGAAFNGASPDGANGAGQVLVANTADATLTAFLDYGSDSIPNIPNTLTPAAETAAASATSVSVSATVTSSAPSYNPVGEGLVDFSLVNRDNQVVATSDGNVVGAGVASTKIAVSGGIPAGSYTILAGYHDGTDVGVTLGTSTLNVSGTEVVPASVPYGTASVSLSATEIASCTTSSCTDASEGLITFTVKQGSTQIGSPVSGQVGTDGSASATFTIPANTPIGDYSIDAAYTDTSGTPGCTTCTGKFTDDSGTSTLTITPANTSATVSDSQGIIVGAAPGTATFSAKITNTSNSAPVNEGVVSFYVLNSSGNQVGSEVYGQVTNGAASASFTIPAGTAAGSYTIFADYYDGVGSSNCTACNGNFNDAAEVSSTLTVTNTPANTSTAVGQASAVYGAANASLTATISNTSCASGQTCPAVTEGMVTFTVMNGTTQLGQAIGQVSNGSATASFTVPAGTGVGSYTVNASYTDVAGTTGCTVCNGAFNDSNGSGTLEITPAATKTTVTTNPSVSFGASSVGLSATVENTSADPNVPATEGMVTFTVTQGTTQVGSPVSAQVQSGGAALATFQIPAGTAAGSYTVTASYTDKAGTAGCTACNGSLSDSSNTGMLAITEADTTTAVSSSPSVAFGVPSASLTATVANASVPAAVVNEGSVTFTVKNGSTPVGQASGLVKNGAASASFSIPDGLGVGQYSISASYSDASPNLADSSSVTNGTLTITQANTTTIITSNPLATIGQSGTTLSASVTNASCPSGVTCRAVSEGTLSFSVTNSAGTTVFTSAALNVSGGSASTTMPLTGLPTGIYTVKASYGGTANYGASSDSGTLTIGYQLVTLPGSTSTVQQGYFALIRFLPRDANGSDIASRALKATSVELDGPNGEVIPFVHQFQFGQFSGENGYQLTINTRNLGVGKWTLKLTLSDNPQVVYSLAFEVE